MALPNPSKNVIEQIEKYFLSLYGKIVKNDSVKEQRWFKDRN